MTTQNKLNEFWENRNELEPFIAKRRAWDFDSFARDKRQIGLIYQIKDQSVIDNLLELNEILSEFDCYNPFPKEHFHVTLKILGTISNEKESPNDYSISNIDDLLFNLKTKISWFYKFQAKIKLINLFPSVLFAEVFDNGKFLELNKIICETNDIVTFPERDLENYIPHIALGNFKNNNIKDFVDKVSELRNLDFGMIEVNSINLVKVDLTAPVPEFERLNMIELGDK
ncbi:MAG: hypothetical protein PF638_03810 [Candidatus Delongbacteria bacterium]|jgi:2'-5' RNA ligase|nr:hypothetical protein [Candidatus Delongbacteria bacterium]